MSDILKQLWETGTLSRGIWETVYMTFLSTLIAYIVGLPLGVVLAVTGEGGIRPMRWLNRALGIIVNVFRSIPFIVLMVAMLPVAKVIVGTSIGNAAMIVMLVIAAAPYVARMVESSLKEVSPGVIEAAQSMGTSDFGIIRKVMIPEAKPALIVGAVISTVTVLGYSAMAATIGGGGLGGIAIIWGHQRSHEDIIWVCVLLIVLIVLVNDAERRLPVQYSKRVVGRKMYGGQSTHLPMKVNMSGVLPIIFAQSIASLPATICAFVPKWQNSWVMKHIFDTTTWPYIVLYFLLIIFFSYFYSTIQFNPIEVANNLKKNGGFIPGFRAGKPTSEFIQKVLNKITLFGAIYLSVIAITPLIISACSKAEQLTGISLGGTSIIIVVGVALETVRALEAQMLMRNYKGFLS